MTRGRSTICGALAALVLDACSQQPELVVGRLDTGREQAAERDAEATPVQQFDASSTLPNTEVLPPPDAGNSDDPAPVDASATSPAPDTGSNGGACAAQALLHDYVFTGNDVIVADRIAGADAQLVGGRAQTSADGMGLALDGDDDYVQLPAHLLAGLQSATLTLWFAIDGGPGYVRLLDFGKGSTDPAVEGDGSVGRSYLAITPATGLERTGLAALASPDGAPNEVAIDTDLEVRDDVMHQVTFAIDAEAAQLRLYLDGTRVGAADFDFALAEIDDQNNWLGRSQYDADPYIEADLYRLKVFGSALSDCQVQSDWLAGVRP